MVWANNRPLFGKSCNPYFLLLVRERCNLLFKMIFSTQIRYMPGGLDK